MSRGKVNKCYDPAVLAAWQKTGVFPDIHQDLADLVVERARGRRFLDLCCDHGILGQQIMTRVPDSYVIGLEADPEALVRAKTYGIQMPITKLRLDPSNYDELTDLMVKHKIDVLVARRCISEVLGYTLWSAKDFAQAVYDGGARELCIQGRAPAGNAVHPVPNVEKEIELLSSKFRLVHKDGQCAYLTT